MGMVFTFLKARGLPTGSSLVEDDFVETAKKVEEVAKEKGCKIILPSDVVLADKFAPDAETKVTSASEIPDGWMGLDNGPEATKEIQSELSECKTIILNGPMGVFEFDAFAKGTFDVADTLAELTGKGACTIIGGGDSVAALRRLASPKKCPTCPLAVVLPLSFLRARFFLALLRLMSFKCSSTRENHKLAHRGAGFKSYTV